MRPLLSAEMLKLARGHMRFQPGANLCAEGLLFGSVRQVHDQNFAALPVSTKASRLFWLSSCMYISSVKPCSQR